MEVMLFVVFNKTLCQFLNIIHTERVPQKGEYINHNEVLYEVLTVVTDYKEGKKGCDLKVYIAKSTDEKMISLIAGSGDNKILPVHMLSAEKFDKLKKE